MLEAASRAARFFTSFSSAINQAPSRPAPSNNLILAAMPKTSVAKTIFDFFVIGQPKISPIQTCGNGTKQMPSRGFHFVPVRITDFQV